MCETGYPKLSQHYTSVFSLVWTLYSFFTLDTSFICIYFIIWIINICQHFLHDDTVQPPEIRTRPSREKCSFKKTVVLNNIKGWLYNFSGYRHQRFVDIYPKKVRIVFLVNAMWLCTEMEWVRGLKQSLNRRTYDFFSEIFDEIKR